MVKDNQYEDKDFVDVVDENDVPLEAPVPKRWLGTDLLPPGTKKAGAKSADKVPDKTNETPVGIPEGDPTEEWTIKQIDAYAEREKIDLKDAGKAKAEKLAAIAAAKASTAS